MFSPSYAVRDLTDEQKTAMARSTSTGVTSLRAASRLLATSLAAEPEASDRELGGAPAPTRQGESQGDMAGVGNR